MQDKKVITMLINYIESLVSIYGNLFDVRYNWLATRERFGCVIRKLVSILGSWRKPRLKHLKVISSLFFYQRSKLDDKSDSMVFTRYHSIGAYNLYNLVTQKVYINRDVFLNELEAWNWWDTFVIICDMQVISSICFMMITLPIILDNEQERINHKSHQSTVSSSNLKF